MGHLFSNVTRTSRHLDNSLLTDEANDGQTANSQDAFSRDHTKRRNAGERLTLWPLFKIACQRSTRIGTKSLASLALTLSVWKRSTFLPALRENRLRSIGGKRTCRLPRTIPRRWKKVQRTSVPRSSIVLGLSHQSSRGCAERYCSNR
jgi:hypothetical protein